MHTTVVIKMNNIRVLLPSFQQTDPQLAWEGEWLFLLLSLYTIAILGFSGIWNSNQKFYISQVYN